MKSIGRKLCACLLAAVAFTGCSLKERLPDLSIPKVKMPELGKREPDLPAHVGPAGTGSYLFYQNCAKCHGDPPSPSFAKMMENVPTITNPQRVKSLDQRRFRQIISEGGGGVGRRESMPSFKDVLSEDEIRRIVSYLNGNPV